MTVTAFPGPPEDHDSPLPLALFRALHERSTEIVTILERDGHWRTTNPAGTRVFGWPAGWDPGPAGIFGLLHPDDTELAQRALAEVIAGDRDPDTPVILRVRDTDDRWHFMETRGQDLSDDPDIRGIVITARDVTERLAAEEKLRLLYSVLEASTQVVLLYDASGRVLYANGMARECLGLGDEVEPSAISPWLSPESVAEVDEIRGAVDRTGMWSGEISLQTADGEARPLAVTVQSHREEGHAPFVSVIGHDISELKLTQARLEHQATHDALTGLPNRALFQELGEQALARAHRFGTTVAVLFLDLDRFKPVNDSFGHPAGDELLVHVAARLRATVRRGDIVARFGGDEFVVLCEHPAGQTEMCELAKRLIATLSEPVPIGSTTAEVGASIGIAIGGGARVTIDALIRDADAALYRAKELGRGQAVLFGEAR